MSLLTPTAPYLSELNDHLEVADEPTSAFQNVEAEVEIGSNFKSTYLLYEQLFRPFEEIKNPHLIQNLVKLRHASNDHGMHQLFVLEKIFRCHVAANNRHAASLILEEIIAHIDNEYKISISEFRELSHILRLEGQGFASLMFTQINSILVLRRRPKPNDKVISLQVCVLKLRDTCEILFKHEYNRPVMVHYVIPLMQELINSIRGMPAVDPPVKAERLSWSLSFLSQSFAFLKLWEDAKKANEEALEVMKSIFGEKAPQFRVVGICSHQLGMAYYNMGNYKLAVHELEEAVQNRIKGEDYRCAETRRKKIEISTKCLNLARSKC